MYIESVDKHDYAPHDVLAMEATGRKIKLAITNGTVRTPEQLIDALVEVTMAGQMEFSSITSVEKRKIDPIITSQLTLAGLNRGRVETFLSSL